MPKKKRTAMSIRFKIVLPYLLLTLVIAIIGVYVVTRLVFNTLNDRLTNQLLEAGRIVSDETIRLEISHATNARLVAYTVGVAEAVRDNDQAKLISLVKPVTGGSGVECLIIVNAQGRGMMYLQKQADGSLVDAGAGSLSLNLPIVQTLLASKDPNALPGRQFGENPSDGKRYYYSAFPIAANGQMVGVVVVGTSLNTFLRNLQSTLLADVVLYQENGVAIGASFLADADLNELLELSISPEVYKQALDAQDIVSGGTLLRDGRVYSTARGPVVVGGDRLGVFSVTLPLNFVVQSSSLSRNTYVLIFSTAMLLVILIGYIISRLITNPLYSLVKTSQAIAGGNLEKRTGINTTDEIGVLAQTFDEMTGNLQQRTVELEKANKTLEQMDRTKGSFIQISAHELRTPLTLIMGYSAMLEQSTEGDPELNTLAKGILEGTNRMTEVVDSMLDVSRIDNKTLTVKKTNLQISLLVQKVHKTFMDALGERHLKFEMAGLDMLPLVPADSDMLYKVFYHIIMNAIKYTPDGGLITVLGRAVNNSEPPEVEIAVKDTGIGIDPQSHDLIFNKFYQTGEVLLHSSGKTKFKGGGPGLGLAIARGIIEAHKGRIWVESPGHNEKTNPGSTFYIRLPVDEQKK
jgi:signal transduction histidine kinase